MKTLEPLVSLVLFRANASYLFVFVRPTQMKAFSLSKAKETEAITEGSTAAVAE